MKETNDDYSKHVTVEADGTKFSRRFGPAAEGHLKAFPKRDTKKYQNYAKPQAVTDMFATLPRWLARWAAAHAPAVSLDLPYTSMTVNIEMLGGQSADRDQGLEWLVHELAESVVDGG